MSLVINSLGVDTHTYAYSHHGQKQFQKTSHTLAFGRHVPGLKNFVNIANAIACSQNRDLN